MFIQVKVFSKEGDDSQPPHSLHTCNADTLWQPCPSNNPYESLQVHPLTQQVSSGIVHCDSSWVLLAVSNSNCLTMEVRALEICRACTSQGWPFLVSVIPSQYIGVILRRGRYVKGAFSLWDCFPIQLVQMAVPVTPAGTLLRLSLHILPRWQKHNIFASGTFHSIITLLAGKF